MPVEEFNMWLAYFENKYEEEKKAMDKMKLRSKSARR